MIDILIPVFSRPGNIQPLVESIHFSTGVPYEVIFLATEGDDAEIAACEATGHVVHVTSETENSYARKINIGATLDYTDHPWLFLGADDLRFHPGWTEAALEAAGDRRVVGTNDLGNATVMKGEHATHSLVHRSYADLGTIDAPGPKLLHEYEHNYTDTEFVATAKHRGEWTFAADSHVEHLHPFWRKGADDEVYRKGRKKVNRDAGLFKSRRHLWTDSRR